MSLSTIVVSAVVGLATAAPVTLPPTAGVAAFARACAARAGRASLLLRDRDVVPAGSKRYVYRTY